LAKTVTVGGARGAKNVKYKLSLARTVTVGGAGGAKQYEIQVIIATSKTPVVFLSKKLYPYCLVLVGSRKGFELEFTIKLK